MARILVTGAEGFIGNAIVTELIRAGHHVLAADIMSKQSASLRFFITAPSDITRTETLEPLVKQATHIIHTAGLVKLDADPDALDKVNHLGTRNLLEAVKLYNPGIEMLVHLSSIGVYGKNSRAPIYEEDEQIPRNAYEISKHNAEKAVKECVNDFPITILRPSFVYGIGCQYKEALPLFRMLQGKKMPMVKKGPRASHVHVEDVANAAVFLLDRQDLAGEAFNICNDSPITLEDFVKAMAGPFDVEVNACLPYSPRAMRALRWMMNKLPKKVIKKANKYLQNKWNACREKNGINEGLAPCIDTAWLDYLAEEKVFSIEKLESVGFSLKHNSPKEDLKELAEYYIERNLA